jgi:stromal membrane-associated protein
VAPQSAMGDLFDLSSPPVQTSPPISPAPAANASSVFNLSTQSKPSVPPPAQPQSSTIGSSTSSTNWSNADVWGNAWGAPESTVAASTVTKAAEPSKPATNDFGWGPSPSAVDSGSLASQSIVPGASGGFSTAPKVSADEEFGGWSTGAGGGGGTAKPASGFGASEDLFSNVWQ